MCWCMCVFGTWLRLLILLIKCPEKVGRFSHFLMRGMNLPVLGLERVWTGWIEGVWGVTSMHFENGRKSCTFWSISCRNRHLV